MYSGKPDEGDVRWVELEQLSRMKPAGGMETMLKVFLGEDISEHFFAFEGGNVEVRGPGKESSAFMQMDEKKRGFSFFRIIAPFRPEVPGGSRRFPEVPGGSRRFPEVPGGLARYLSETVLQSPFHTVINLSLSAGLIKQ